MPPNREFSTRFFTDDAPGTPTEVPFDPSDPAIQEPGFKGDWGGHGEVIWARGTTLNELLQENSSKTLLQPETPKELNKTFDAKSDRYAWSLFVPSKILTQLKAATAGTKPELKVAVLLGRSREEVGYGLRFFFERAGTGVLVCLGGRERSDPGGRWNVGISQGTVERILTEVLTAHNVLAKDCKPEIEVSVLAGYSTGYGVVQTINNELVPLASVKRLV